MCAKRAAVKRLYLQQRVDNHNAVALYRKKLEQEKNSLEQEYNLLSSEEYETKEFFCERISIINSAIIQFDQSISGVLIEKQLNLIQADEIMRSVLIEYKGQESGFFKACAMYQQVQYSSRLKNHIDNPSIESFENLPIGDKEILLERYVPFLVASKKQIRNAYKI